jgi:hypothetical protein
VNLRSKTDGMQNSGQPKKYPAIAGYFHAALVTSMIAASLIYTSWIKYP